MPGQPSSDRDLEVRIANQVDRIRTEFLEKRGITINYVAKNGGVAYMYAAGQILVRDSYLQPVYEIFNRSHSVDPDQVTRVAPGVSLITQPRPGKRSKVQYPTVLEALEIIDRDHRAGIATPNHVVTVAPAGPCPATEPDEVDYGIEPFPSVCVENGGAGILVYVADTGLLQDFTVDHPWLTGVRRALKADGSEQDPDPAGIVLDGTTTIPPYAGHGTFVAGVVRCMAPEAELIVSNIFQVAGSVLEADLATELCQALALGVDIFHLSISTTTRLDLTSLGFDGFRELLHQYKGVVCVVAAGNQGDRIPSWPAAYPEMVSVGALGGDWRGRAQFSNYGGWVDVYAPGRDLVNAFATGPYTCDDYPYTGVVRHFYGMARWSGTSFSTPIVTGLIAARMSRTGENGLEAAAALLAEARSQAIPGVGPILLPCGYDACKPPRRGGCGCREAGRRGCGCGCGCGPAGILA
jgi:hypothetical protein